MWRLVRRYRVEFAVIVAAFCVVAIVGVASFRSIIVERDRAAQKQAEAVQRADELTLIQARTALDRDPNKAIGWLRSLSPSFTGWRAVRFIAADAKARGRFFRYPEQGRTLAALDRLAETCRARGITREQAIHALDPVLTRWFPYENFNVLDLLPQTVPAPVACGACAGRAAFTPPPDGAGPPPDVPSARR